MAPINNLNLRIIAIISATLLVACAPRAAFAAAPTPGTCVALATASFPGHTIKVIEAREVSAATDPNSQQLPAHCLWRGEIDPRTGVDGYLYSIGFELRLPVAWNGKFFFQGGGGMDGVVRPAIGAMPNGASTAPVALARGYAVASTDAGHEGSDGTFGADQQARLDYYYGAIERVAELAHQILPGYYGKPLSRSYFVGCSNGGRQALIAAQRFPLLFDGVVAADPAFNLTRAAVAEIWDDRTYLHIAPKDADGQPILSKAFSEADLHLLSQSILARCDALDGVKDGLIDNPLACHYDPAVLTCAPGQRESCLSAPQVAALKTAFAGPHSANGRPLYSDWPFDSGLDASDWRAWKLGTSTTPQSNAVNMTLGPDATRSIHLDTYQPTLTVDTFDLDRAAEDSRTVGGFEDATATMMDTFHKRGGRLLLLTGMSDPIFSANDLIRYYRKIELDNGGELATTPWAKLFLIPGMTHCSGGPALDDFDPLTALDTWVEGGSISSPWLAKGKSFPNRARPLCAFPEYPHYGGSGSLDDAKNFSCHRDLP